MNPVSHEGKGPIGDPAGITSDCVAESLGDQAIRWSQTLPLSSADAALAMFSFTGNRVLADQIRSAHALGHLAHTQAQTLVDASETVMPEGPVRDTLAIAARMHAAFGDGVIEAANSWGRRYGHLAFALPVPDWRG
jgi:hypothetical protein